MLDFQAAGAPTVDYGNNIRQMARETGVENAFDFPGFVPAYIRPPFFKIRQFSNSFLETRYGSFEFGVGYVA